MRTVFGFFLGLWLREDLLWMGGEKDAWSVDARGVANTVLASYGKPVDIMAFLGRVWTSSGAEIAGSGKSDV